MGVSPCSRKQSRQKLSYFWNKVQYLETSGLSEFSHQNTSVVFPKYVQMLLVITS